jgi:hypothetical protein
MRGRRPTAKESRWMTKVAELGCIVCLDQYDIQSPAEIHHIEGRTQRGAHFLVLPLCFRHHREGNLTELDASRHPWKSDFEERYGTEQHLLGLVKEMLGR